MEESEGIDVDNLNLHPTFKPYVDNFVAGIRADGIEHLFRLQTPQSGDKDGRNNTAIVVAMYDFRGNEMKLFFQFLKFEKRLGLGKILQIVVLENWLSIS